MDKPKGFASLSQGTAQQMFAGGEGKNKQPIWTRSILPPLFSLLLMRITKGIFSRQMLELLAHGYRAVTEGDLKEGSSRQGQNDSNWVFAAQQQPWEGLTGLLE